jgi:hypothetical protein
MLLSVQHATTAVLSVMDLIAIIVLCATQQCLELITFLFMELALVLQNIGMIMLLKAAYHVTIAVTLAILVRP